MQSAFTDFIIWVKESECEDSEQMLAQQTLSVCTYNESSKNSNMSTPIHGGNMYSSFAQLTVLQRLESMNMLGQDQMMLDTFLHSSLSQRSKFLNYYSIHKPAVLLKSVLRKYKMIQRSFEVHVLCSHICYPVIMWHQSNASYSPTNTRICTPSHKIITSCTSALWSCLRRAGVQSKFNETDPSHNHWCTHT